MKRIFAAAAVLLLSALVAFAQDFNAAVDAFNAGAKAQETDKAEALTQFRAALAIVQTLEDPEAAALAAKCKDAIAKTLLSSAKEDVNNAKYDEALAALAQTQAVAAEYGAAEVGTEAASLVPNVYMRKGSTLLKEKDFAGAAEALAKVTELTPDNGQAFLLLGQAKLQAGSADEAIAALEKAHELEVPQAAKLLSTTYLKQGAALLKEGKNAQAIEALEKSNSYQESANAYKLIANAYTKSGKSAQAIENFKKYLEVNPGAKDAPDILFTIAATAQKSGDKATAKEYYKKLAGTKYAAQAEAQLKVL